MTELAPLPITSAARLLVLTGAGISAESGIATFRGSDGLWNGEDPAQVASRQGFRTDPTRAWRFYADLRRQALAARPNAAHRALAEAGRKLGPRMLLVTQNIDGLHTRAGSDPLEIHGSLFRTRCLGCARPAFPDKRTAIKAALACERCGGLLRPDVVWFGEELDPAHLRAIKDFIRHARHDRALLAFLAIGTSGAVWPANHFATWVREAHGVTWLANLEPPENAADFNWAFYGLATVSVPILLAGANGTPSLA